MTPLWARPLQISSSLLDEELQMAFHLPFLDIQPLPMRRLSTWMHGIRLGGKNRLAYCYERNLGLGKSFVR
jgi:hypothetical protein